MNLLLDLGNSRLKWGLSEGTTLPLVARGWVPYSDAGLQSLVTAWRDLDLDHVRYASVVDSVREQAVLSLLPTASALNRFVVAEQFGTLRNNYATPETLGLDRWAAAIGAWSKVNNACLVISAGTATTIDIIEVTSSMRYKGVYRGGAILPGLELMRQSLHQGTARLPAANGRHRPAPDVPDNTADAMASGVIEATCGAIERLAKCLPADASWLLTGGHAQTLQEALGKRVTVLEDLVLEGLAQI